MIGLIRQCIGHNVFHHVAQETSAYELWIKLKEMYQEGHIKRDCPKYKAHNQSSDTAATVVIAVDEDEIDVLLAASEDGKSDRVLDSSSAYHLCRDRKVFFTYAPCEGRISMANNTASRVVGKGSVRFYTADGRERRLEGYTDWREVSRQGELLSDMSSVVLARRMDKGSNRSTEVRKGNAGVLGGSVVLGGSRALGYVQKSGQTRVVQPVQDVHREAQKKETKFDFEKLYSEGHGDAKAILWESWIRSCQEGQLEDIRLPSSELEGEIVKSNPSG
ncbi:hypothetical protein Acr_17g0006910 [Actinidia rufa]|uniref:Retrovirus-related Pol polyprotein from transposon TNT 1-94-like beta-barrel domain-containing protein n=1 Tax=Actinidia rufa TaxID=165716 RepID=A0A7J0G2X1_9ERIC|nr:hypothetical protein Acr_17g0006910 [Actinidia rufa]